MVKIFMSVRNRLSITLKAIEALERHSKLPHDIHIFDNCTTFKVREHYEFAYNLMKHGIVVSYNFNSDRSTFKAFSKAVSCNQFGYLHMMDPNWKSYDFLLILDNDIVVLPDWDLIIKKAWYDIKKMGLNNIKIIGQSPGGIKGKKFNGNIAGVSARIGILGGSGFWSVKPDFFKDVGFLSIKDLVGHDKQHDQKYWRLLNQSSCGKPYIIGLNKNLCIHCGSIAGSVCNKLSRNRNNKNKLDLIKFEDAENRIGNMSFNEFMNFIKNNNKLKNDW